MSIPSLEVRSRRKVMYSSASSSVWQEVILILQKFCFSSADATEQKVKFYHDEDLRSQAKSANTKQRTLATYFNLSYDIPSKMKLFHVFASSKIHTFIAISTKTHFQNWIVIFRFEFLFNRNSF